VDYYHVVFTLPAAISQLAFYNKADMYGLLMKAAARTLATIAGDPKHLGAHIGTTMVLHTWGSAMVHHPHVHCIVPGGGIKNENIELCYQQSSNAKHAMQRTSAHWASTVTKDRLAQFFFKSFSSCWTP
jgi:hypothetical protein